MFSACFQDSGTWTSLKGACEPGKANGHRSVRYECFPGRKLRDSRFSEPECRRDRLPLPGVREIYISADVYSAPVCGKQYPVRETPAGISGSSVPIQISFHCLSHGSVRYRHRNRERACVYSAGISRGRQPVPAGVTVEKSRKPFVFLLFQDSGTRTSLKGASEPGKANKHRSVRYESLPCGNPGTASFPEPEQRQGQHTFPQRPEDTVIFRLP